MENNGGELLEEKKEGRKIAINFEDFTFKYESQSEPTLHDINLKIYEGEKVVIIGASGSGKSTLGHCINGLAPYFYKGEIEGKLEIYGKRCKEIFEHSKYVGTVLQDSDAQFVGLTVAEDIAFALENDEVETTVMYISLLKYSNDNLEKYDDISNLEKIDFSAAKDNILNWIKYNSPKESTKSENTLLKLENISFSYNKKRKILKNINLSVEKGEMISIVGSNGAGKSTLSKVIAGFERQDEGKIYYKSLDISEESIAKRAEKIGFVLQNPNAMISKVTVFEEVALGLKTRGVSEDEIEKRVLEILEICKLKPFRKWPIKALSYGQKKRVTIASVLVLEPEIIIVDEPTAGQDLFHYREIMEFLKRLNEYGITILFITHDMHLMLEYTDKAYVFNEGKIIKSGNPAQILADKKVLEQANLRETSLHYVAEKIEINSEELISTFVHYEKNCEKEQKKAGD